MVGLRLAWILWDPVSRKEEAREGGWAGRWERETRREGGRNGGREEGDQSFIQQMFDALSSQEPSPKAFKRIHITTQLQNALFSLYLFYCLLAQKVCSCQYFRFLLLKSTSAFLTVNSLSSTLGAKFKYLKAITQPGDSEGLGFPFAVKCFMMLVDEMIIVLAFVETGGYPGLELTDTLVSEGRNLLPLYF